MRWIVIFILALVFAACASRYTVPQSYKALEVQLPVESPRTVVLFLIDCLPVDTLKQALRENALPNIQQHFLSSGRKLYKAHTVFPSLTYPSISSLLHAEPVSKTQALGNSIVQKGRLIHFESMTDREHFSDEMRGNNVFTRLTELQKSSVSLDYGLGVDASVAAETVDLKSGLAAEFKDYLYLDQKKLASLKLLLQSSSVEHWPSFIFVHLVGVDFLSHQHGSESAIVSRYLKSLDSSLSEVFQLLKQGENRKPVISMLSADHGFRPRTNHYVDIDKAAAGADNKLRVINEARMAALYYPLIPSAEMQGQWARKLLAVSQVEAVAYRSGSKITLATRSKQISVDIVNGPGCAFETGAISINGGALSCPEALDPISQNLLFPYFIQNMTYYFQAEKHPDMVVIPAANAAFSKAEVGYHGGPTAEEVYVPLLLRNAVLGEGQVPALWDLLKFL
jgi:hypothetical protein